jgi:hypothetical protein
MNRILGTTLALCLAAPALASPQTHHCQKDGAEVKLTHKECTKAGGKWEKGAPSADAKAPAAETKAAPAPAAKDAPAAKPAPAPAK